MPEPKQPVTVLKSQRGGDIRQLRCPHCRSGMVSEVAGPKGAKFLRCNSCGKTLTSRPI